MGAGGSVGAGLLESMPEDNRARMLEALTGLPDAEREHFLASVLATRSSPTARSTSALIRRPSGDDSDHPKLDPGRVTPAAAPPASPSDGETTALKVAVRIRPWQAHDGEKAASPAVRAVDATRAELTASGETFELDHVFGEDASQTAVFDACVLPLVDIVPIELCDICTTTRANSQHSPSSLQNQNQHAARRTWEAVGSSWRTVATTISTCSASPWSVSAAKSVGCPPSLKYMLKWMPRPSNSSTNARNS